MGQDEDEWTIIRQDFHLVAMHLRQMLHGDVPGTFGLRHKVSHPGNYSSVKLFCLSISLQMICCIFQVSQFQGGANRLRKFAYELTTNVHQ